MFRRNLKKTTQNISGSFNLNRDYSNYNNIIISGGNYIFKFLILNVHIILLLRQIYKKQKIILYEINSYVLNIS